MREKALHDEATYLKEAWEESFAEGYAEGYSEGYAKGYSEGYDERKNEIFARLREMGCSEEDIGKIRVL